MNKHRFHLFISILIVVALSLLVFAPAQAGGGEHELITIPVDDEWVWEGDWNPCGFDIEVHTTGTFRLNLWYDEENRVVKEMRIDGNLKQTGSAFGKTTITLSQGPQTNFFTYQEDGILLVQRLRGTSDLIFAPGVGKLFSGGGLFIEVMTFDLDWNMLTYDLVKNVGGYEYVDFWEEFQPVCEYFSSE